MSTNMPDITPEELLAHGAWLHRLAARLVDPATAEDLVQETWATAVRARPDRERPLRPWLGQVLRNLVRMRARGAGRWAARLPRIVAADDQPLPSPEDLMTFHETQRLVAQAVAALEEPYRSTVLLCYAQGIEPAEIARRQGVPGGTVRWRLKRGLDQIRVELDARYGHDRRAWCVALAPLAARAGAGLAVGYGSSWKLVAGLAAVIALGAGIMLWKQPSSAPASEHPAVAGASDPRTPRPLVAAPRLVTPPSPGGPGAPPPSGGHRPPLALAPAAANAPSPGATVDPAEALRRAAEPGDAPARGNPKAPVTIVSFSEFQCPFCARVQPTLRELLAAYPDEVRLVWKHLPLPFHEAAGIAAEASMAAHEQGKFWEMHDRLFAQQERLDPATLQEHAKALGLDVEKFQVALDSGKYRKTVEADAKVAADASINGTPTFLINGEKLMGAQPLESFKQKVEEALARAKGLPPPKPKPVAPPAAPAQAAVARPPMANPFWPPPALPLPDAVLGETVSVRFATGRAPLRGNPKGPVEVLYFTSLASPDTRARYMVDGLLATYGAHVKVLAKLMPGYGPSETRTLAAEAGMAAHEQGKFWELYDALHQRGSFPPFDRAKLEKAATAAGLDVGELGAALDDGRHKAALEEEADQRRAAGVNEGTLIVNGRAADGPVALVRLVEAAIKKAGRKPPPWPAGSSVEVDPRAAGYDGRRVAMVLSQRQLYSVEPRDDAWAGPLEKELGALIEKDLRAVEPKLGGATLDCRSSLCRLRWRAGKGDEKAITATAHFLYGSPIWGFQRQLPAAELILSLRANGSSTAQDALAQLRSKRSTRLFTVRTGRAKVPPGVPVERLPKE